MSGSCRGTDAPFPATGNPFSSTDDSFQATDGSFPGADDPRSYKNGVFSLKSQKLEVEKLTTKTKRILLTTKFKKSTKDWEEMWYQLSFVFNLVNFVSFVVNLTGQEKSIIYHEDKKNTKK